jgi:hypothetical protein
MFRRALVQGPRRSSPSDLRAILPRSPLTEQKVSTLAAKKGANIFLTNMGESLPSLRLYTDPRYGTSRFHSLPLYHSLR